MEDLINSVRMLYDHHGPEERAVSPPLPSPPTQDEEMPTSRTSAHVYGSAHTVIKTLPPQGTSPTTTSEIAPKVPPRVGRQARRATVSTGSGADAASSSAADLSIPSSSRPSEDGRATGYIRPSPGSITPSSSKQQQLRLELKTPSGNTSSTSSPIKERESRVGTGTSHSAPSSKNASDVALQPGHGTVTDSSLSLATPTTANTSGVPTKRPSYSDSLLREPAVLMAAGLSNEFSGEVEEVDYLGSPDTSALEFRTAVNTPEAEEVPYPLGGL